MDIHDSIQHLMSLDDDRDHLGQIFYGIFLRDFPELQHHFDQVDMERQANVLTMSLLIVEQHFRHSYPATEEYLLHLGAQHKSIGIGEELYPHWRRVMLDTLRSVHGRRWTPALESQWCEALDLCIATMLRPYHAAPAAK